MNQIQDPPNNYDFGYDFDYSLWSPNTVVDLVNVPWNNDYRDVVKFSTPNGLDTYIDSLNPSGVKIEYLSYVKPNEPVRINIPFNRAVKYNYLRANNPIQPITPTDEHRNFYYFILDVRYVAPNTTELILQLDVWQSYINHVTIGRCYVERGHIGIANTKQFDNFGRDYLTVPEGLDIGGEYRHIMYSQREIMSSLNHDILVVSTTDLKSDPGDVTNPILKTANGQNFEHLPTGANMYIFEDMFGFFEFMEYFSARPWVTQGIISITLVPKVTNWHPNFEYTDDIVGGGSEGPADVPKKNLLPMKSNWRDAKEINDALTTRYKNLKKFKTFPYLAIELTTYSGNILILKPESWNNRHAEILEMAILFPPNQRIVFSPVGYNSSALTEGSSAKPLSDNLNVNITFGNFPSIPIVNNGAINFMAANKNMLQFQRNSAEWTQQRALGMAQGQYDIASGAINLANQLTGISIGADISQTANANRTQAAQAIWGAIGGVAGGAAQGGAMGGGAGAAAGAAGGAIGGITNGVNTAIGIAANDESLAIRNLAARSSVGAQNQQTGLIRDTNKGLADWAARGDYANAIAGINAKVQDAQLTPPSTSGNFGGEAFNILNSFAHLHVKWKMIDNAAMKVVGEYWLRYGYAIRASIAMPSSFMVMKKFTYWKLTETYISSSFVPEGFKQAIRGIFEKGVTVWADPTYIGNTDWADNEPLDGVSY